MKNKIEKENQFKFQKISLIIKYFKCIYHFTFYFLIFFPNDAVFLHVFFLLFGVVLVYGAFVTFMLIITTK